MFGDYVMKIQLSYILPFCLMLTACVNSAQKSGSTDEGFIRVSHSYPRYFETTKGETWIPVMMNYLIPDGNEKDVYEKTEKYFKHFSENGGNAVRIWISGSFLEIEDRKVGEYDPVKFRHIDHLLALAKKYDLRVKFTLQHIRTIGRDEDARKVWANREYMYKGSGGIFNDIHDYLSTPEGRRAYLDRVRALAEHYRDNPQIFGWELWNEMDAVSKTEWYTFTVDMLDSVKALLPNHLIVQTLGSMDSEAADQRYEKFLTIAQNVYIPVHRYLKPDASDNYMAVHGPVDLMISDAVNDLYRPDQVKPVVFNETGVVKLNYAGPSDYYAKDTAGVFIHDMIFAPFFCGAAGSGSLWHWDSYVENQDLWYHYRRFRNAIKGIDPVAEAFIPFHFSRDSVRCYGLKGKDKSMIWCRDGANNWRTELQQGLKPQIRKNFSFSLQKYVLGKYTSAKIYDPWKDKWTRVKINGGIITLPDFVRSSVIVLE